MAVKDDVILGQNVKIFHPDTVNLYGCTLGDNTRVGTFVEIQKGASVGKNCKISSHSFICEGVTIEDDVFIGHGVMFTNDLYPRATSPFGKLQTEADWKIIKTVIKKGASIGSNATILAGITINEGAIIGAGSVVTHDVQASTIVAGNPAQFIRNLEKKNMNIPLVNLKEQYLSIKNELDPAVIEVLSNCNFVLGKQVENFEQEFAKFCGAKYCVGVASGWDAIHLSLRALGIGPGDEVITVPNTFIATVFPILAVGAKPVFVEINPDTYQMDVKKLEKAINKKTKAILPVHLYGISPEMDKIKSIARKHKLFLVEDVAQAHGASYKGHHAGTFGDVAAFSFYPGKNLGAAGEAGGIITNNKSLYEKIRIMRDVGQSKKYVHSMYGVNSRMATIQAAVLGVKLKKLADWNAKRREVASEYRKLLSDLPIILPPDLGSDYVFNYHVFPIRIKKRNGLLAYLKSQGVNCGIHYPIPVHVQKALKSLKYKKGDFPITEKYARELLSLPIFPELTKSEIKYISDLIHKFFKNGK